MDKVNKKVLFGVLGGLVLINAIIFLPRLLKKPSESSPDVPKKVTAAAPPGAPAPGTGATPPAMPQGGAKLSGPPSGKPGPSPAGPPSGGPPGTTTGGSRPGGPPGASPQGPSGPPGGPPAGGSPGAGSPPPSNAGMPPPSPKGADGQFKKVGVTKVRQVKAKSPGGEIEEYVEFDYYDPHPDYRRNVHVVMPVYFTKDFRTKEGWYSRFRWWEVKTEHSDAERSARGAGVEARSRYVSGRM